MVSLPARAVSPLSSVVRRGLFALSLLMVSTVIVWVQGAGYKDSANPGQALSFLDSLYYSTVTLTTTGYGDIVPVTNATRLENTFLITPLRIMFLIALVGTTLGVLAERTRTGWRIDRWRSKVSDHTIVAGFGTKGRSAVRTLRDSGLAAKSIVVVDTFGPAVREANLAGLTGVAGDATSSRVLASAEAAKASRIVIAVPRDDTAVLIALTARQVNPGAVIVATIREAENESLLRQSGADHVIVSAEAAGRLLGLTAMGCAVGDVIANLLSVDGDSGLELTERPVTAGEVGTSVQAASLVAVVRGGAAMSPADPHLGPLAEGDRLVMSTPPGSVPRLAVGVLLVGERARGDVVRERGGGGPEHAGHVGVLLHEPGRPRRQAGHVLPDQDLRVAGRARADADGRHRQCLGHPRGQLGRYAFQHDRERPGRLQQLRVVQQPLAVLAAALHPVTAEGVDRLRGEPEVGHHRDAGRHQLLDLVHDPPAAFELDRLRAGFLEEAAGRCERGTGGALIGAERQVRDHHGPAGGADDRGGERYQLIDGDRDGAGVTVDDHGGRVTDQQDRNARLVEDVRREGVVGGEHRPLLASCLGGCDITDGNPSPGIRSPVQPFVCLRHIYLQA
jgi:voltage-gated potassium channel